MIVPQGHPKIARRFVAGNEMPPNVRVPWGWLENLGRPYGTGKIVPGNELPGYSRVSLRDKKTEGVPKIEIELSASEFVPKHNLG